jgi:hypothetical protein
MFCLWICNSKIYKNAWGIINKIGETTTSGKEVIGFMGREFQLRLFFPVLK